MARNIVKMEEELKVLNAQREDIAKRYAVTDENGNFVLDGNNYTFESEEAKAAFKSESQELATQEVELDLLTVSSKELDACYESERYDIPTPNQEVALDWMLED